MKIVQAVLMLQQQIQLKERLQSNNVFVFLVIIKLMENVKVRFCSIINFKKKKKLRIKL